MSNYVPDDGDRVRVTVEGRARQELSGFSLLLDNGARKIYHPTSTLADANTKVEKIETVVVTFKPGESVRRKSGANTTRHLGNEGYISSANGHYYPYEGPGAGFRLSEFTSACYELA